jgi:hypothetical protein
MTEVKRALRREVRGLKARQNVPDRRFSKGITNSIESVVGIVGDRDVDVYDTVGELFEIRRRRPVMAFSKPRYHDGKKV